MKNICIITGASSGLGAELYKQIQDRYPKLDEIWLIARRKDRMQEAVQEKIEDIRDENKYGDKQRYAVKTEILSMDLSQSESFDRLAEKLSSGIYNIRVLINNAGFGLLGNVEDKKYYEQTDMIDVNCKALTAMCTLCIPHMGEGAAIMNISSIAAFAPNPRLSVYSATKAYVYHYSKALGYELRERKITVTVVCPGPMNTEFLTRAEIKGNSTAFARLPTCYVTDVAAGAVKAMKKGKTVYVNTLIYKFYRIFSRLLPYSVLMHFSKV